MLSCFKSSTSSNLGLATRVGWILLTTELLVIGSCACRSLSILPFHLLNIQDTWILAIFSAGVLELSRVSPCFAKFLNEPSSNFGNPLWPQEVYTHHQSLLFCHSKSKHFPLCTPQRIPDFREADDIKWSSSGEMNMTRPYLEMTDR